MAPLSGLPTKPDAPIDADNHEAIFALNPSCLKGNDGRLIV